MMRLFTAIIFGNEMKDYLCTVMEKLHGFADKGSYTDRDNLHLTLNFIGETDRREQVEQAMQKAALRTGAARFAVTAAGFGRFKRREGDICWVGIEHNPALWTLQKELVTQLKKEDFKVDDLAYTPHLTLARRVVFQEKFDERAFAASVHPVSMEVREISLMKSERIRGKLVYTRIFSVPLP